MPQPLAPTTHGPIPVLAGDIVRIPVGHVEIVEIVAGAQVGLRLCWESPHLGDPGWRSCARMWVLGEKLALAARVLWLAWDAGVDESLSVSLRTWSIGAADVETSRAHRSPATTLVTATVAIAGATITPQVVAGPFEPEPEGSPFASMQVWLGNSSGAGTTDRWAVQVEIGGTYRSVYVDRALNTEDNSAGSPEGRASSGLLPIPRASWRLVYHTNAPTGFDCYVHLTKHP